MRRGDWSAGPENRELYEELLNEGASEDEAIHISHAVAVAERDAARGGE